MAYLQSVEARHNTTIWLGAQSWVLQNANFQKAKKNRIIFEMTTILILLLIQFLKNVSENETASIYFALLNQFLNNVSQNGTAKVILKLNTHLKNVTNKQQPQKKLTGFR